MLALAALTNVALALHIDPQLPQTLVRDCGFQAVGAAAAWACEAWLGRPGTLTRSCRRRWCEGRVGSAANRSAVATWWDA